VRQASAPRKAQVNAVLGGMRYAAILLVCVLAIPALGEENSCDHILDLAVEAALDDPKAQYNLAVEHWRGECVPKDLSKSRVLWRNTLSDESPESYNNLGFLLYYGYGGDEDHKEAIRLWKQGIEYGSLESMIHLANANLDGAFLKRNAREALVLATAGLQCARQLSSQPHVEMALETLSSVDKKPKKGEVDRISALAKRCSRDAP